jgi:hypothetical protein
MILGNAGFNALNFHHWQGESLCFSELKQRLATPPEVKSKQWKILNFQVSWVY